MALVDLPRDAPSLVPVQNSARPVLSKTTNETQFSRDLSWAISSPPLLNLGDADSFPPLLTTDIDIARLSSFMSERKEHRVGHYFENLVHFWLKHIRNVEIIDHRRQVRDEDRTVGEIDFVFRDEAARLVHWETAIKFYLKTPALDDAIPRYLGPNTADSLERKIAHLRDHQLPLSTRVHGQIDIHHAFVKGRIYQHPSDKAATEGPNELAPGHLRGIWIHECELAALIETQAATSPRFTILNKPFWLTRPDESSSGTELARTVAKHFTQSPNSLHIAAYNRDQKETDRLFVVTNGWPN